MVDMSVEQPNNVCTIVLDLTSSIPTLEELKVREVLVFRISGCLAPVEFPGTPSEPLGAKSSRVEVSASRIAEKRFEFNEDEVEIPFSERKTNLYINFTPEVRRADGNAHRLIGAPSARVSV